MYAHVVGSSSSVSPNVTWQPTTYTVGNLLDKVPFKYKQHLSLTLYRALNSRVVTHTHVHETKGVVVPEVYEVQKPRRIRTHPVPVQAVQTRADEVPTCSLDNYGWTCT